MSKRKDKKKQNNRNDELQQADKLVDQLDAHAQEKDQQAPIEQVNSEPENAQEQEPQVPAEQAKSEPAKPEAENTEHKTASDDSDSDSGAVANAINNRPELEALVEQAQANDAAQQEKMAKQRAKDQPPPLAFDEDCGLLVKPKRPFASVIIYFVLAFLIFFIGWAHFSQVDQLTVGEGRVVPSQRIQTIQSVDGGVVSKVAVKRGEMVKKDQILVQLDKTRFNADYQESVGRRQVLLAAIARLYSQANEDEEINFPEEIVNERPDLVVREKALFKQRMASLDSSVAVLKQTYDLLKVELNLIEPLVEEGLVSQVDMIRLQREANNVEGQMQQVRDEARDQTLSKLNQLEAELESLNTASTSLRDKTDKASIRAPIAGVVKDIKIHTVGGVVKPGEPIMQIVPVDDELLIETKVVPSEVAFIRAGQKATVSLSAYDFAIYGSLKGVVKSVGADTVVDEKGEHYYQVMISTDKSYLEHNGKRLEIIPGMTATVHVITGKQTILNYMLKPIFKAQKRALRER